MFRHQRTAIKGIGGGDCDISELLAGQAYDQIYIFGNVIDKYLDEVQILSIFHKDYYS